MRSAVEWVIYLYLAVCVLLLLFNLLYIYRSHWQKKARAQRVNMWIGKLKEKGGDYLLSSKDLKTLLKVEQLTAFFAALTETLLPTDETEVRASLQTSEKQLHMEGTEDERVAEADQAAASRFFIQNSEAFQKMANAYGKKSPMEKAFIAYVIASFREPGSPNRDMMAEILLSYLEDSTVYCRENVLHALYALGSERAVEHAFEILNEHGWHHNPKLISDGMVKFTGDSVSLARRLFRHRHEFEESLTVGIVQFMAFLKDDSLASMLLEALKTEPLLPLEVRFALIRYFQRHIIPEAKEELLDILKADSGADGQLSVAAASVLGRYPSPEVKEALLQALHSRNWYVRRNAAMSLQGMNLTEADVSLIEKSQDRYAFEMLTYAKEVSA